MNAETGNQVLEHLCTARADVGPLPDDMRNLRRRVFSMERHLVNIRIDAANIRQRLGTRGDLLERIERRLELADGPA